MSKRDRRDSDGRDRDRRDERPRRDRDWDDEGQQRRTGEGEILRRATPSRALKAILSKVATLLRPLNLSADESIRLVEQLYGSVLDMDSAMAGEADDTRKSSTLAYIQNTTITPRGRQAGSGLPHRRGSAGRRGRQGGSGAAPAAPAAPQPQRPPQAAPAQARAGPGYAHRRRPGIRAARPKPRAAGPRGLPGHARPPEQDAAEPRADPRRAAPGRASRA